MEDGVKNSGAEGISGDAAAVDDVSANVRDCCPCLCHGESEARCYECCDGGIEGIRKERAAVVAYLRHEAHGQQRSDAYLLALADIIERGEHRK